MRIRDGLFAVAAVLGLVAAQAGPANRTIMVNPNNLNATGPLVCKAPLPLEFNQKSASVSFSFKRGSKPASQGLDAGSCAWQNAAMKLTDGACAAQPNVSDLWFDISQSAPAHTNITSTIAPYVFDIWKMSGKTYSFQVHATNPNNPQYCFAIDKVL